MSAEDEDRSVRVARGKLFAAAWRGEQEEMQEVLGHFEELINAQVQYI